MQGSFKHLTQGKAGLFVPRFSQVTSNGYGKFIRLNYLRASNSGLKISTSFRIQFAFLLKKKMLMAKLFNDPLHFIRKS